MFKQASKSLLEWEPILERMIMARFESKFQKMIILQVYDQQIRLTKTKKKNFTISYRGRSTKSKRRASPMS